MFRLQPVFFVVDLKCSPDSIICVWEESQTSCSLSLSELKEITHFVFFSVLKSLFCDRLLFLSTVSHPVVEFSAQRAIKCVKSVPEETTGIRVVKLWPGSVPPPSLWTLISHSLYPAASHEKE